jgi:hypothetical protein
VKKESGCQKALERKREKRRRTDLVDKLVDIAHVLALRPRKLDVELRVRFEAGGKSDAGVVDEVEDGGGAEKAEREAADQYNG